jgi:hypothetical protein
MIKSWASEDRVPEYTSVTVPGWFERNQEAVDVNDRLQIFLDEKGKFFDDDFYLEEIIEKNG